MTRDKLRREYILAAMTVATSTEGLHAASKAAYETANVAYAALQSRWSIEAHNVWLFANARAVKAAECMTRRDAEIDRKYGIRKESDHGQR